MSSEENKALVCGLFQAINEEVWPTGNLAAADRFISPDFAYHSPAMPFRGREGFHQFLGVYRTAFPDARFTVEDQIAEGDRVLTRVTARGTHQGDLMRIPPSGNPVEVSILTLMRIRDGQILEEWERFDTAYLLQQIGAMSTPGQAGP